MTLQEAIKSKRRFRRPNCPYWSQSPITGGFPYSKITLEFDDILADDWEVEESSVTIYRSQFEAAWKRVVLFDAPQVKELLAKELGL